MPLKKCMSSVDCPAGRHWTLYRRNETVKLQSSSNNIYTDIWEKGFGDHNKSYKKKIRNIKKQYIYLLIADDNMHFKIREIRLFWWFSTSGSISCSHSKILLAGKGTKGGREPKFKPS